MKIPTLDLLKFREPQNQLKYVLPYSFLIQPGVCLLKNGAFMAGGGGIYIEPGKDAVAFQPLSELKSPDECSESEYTESLMWCQQFIEGLLSQQNIETTPEMSKVISETLRLISLKDKDKRSLTTFQQYATYSDPE